MNAKYAISRTGSSRVYDYVEAPAGQISRAAVLAERLLFERGEEGEDWEVHGLDERAPLFPSPRLPLDAEALAEERAEPEGTYTLRVFEGAHEMPSRYRLEARTRKAAIKEAADYLQGCRTDGYLKITEYKGYALSGWEHTLSR